MIPGSANPLLLATAAAGGYTISRSLRFNSADSAYLSRTPASAGNRKTWTWAGWVKRSGLGGFRTIFSAGGNGFLIWLTSDTLEIYNFSSSAFQLKLTSSQVFRDSSAWMHIAFALDTTQSTASERARLFVNGSRVTAFSTATYPSQNSDLLVGDTNLHLLGRISGFSYDFDGYLADLHFCDGTAYDASAFGEFSATTGVWMPKAFSGSYGSQGWKLDFADNSAATAAALGKDTSGNGNNFTPTNLSVTAGAGNDSLIDVPVNGSQTDTGVGGEVRGNYATWNPLAKNGTYNSTLSNGNLDSAASGDARTAWGTIAIPSSGKYYFEVTTTGSPGFPYVGVAQYTGISSAYPQDSYGPSVTYYGTNGQKSITGTYTSYGASYSNATIGVAVNVDSSQITFYKDGVSQGAISQAVVGGFPFVSTAGGSGTFTLNAGQRPFAYTAPSGFKALCTANLPAPTIVKPSTVMDVVLYTGTGSTLTPTSSLGFSPDLVWIKSRSTATDNTLYDAVRGAQARLESNNTDAEVTSDNGLTAFNSAGFTLGTLAQVNTSTATYAAWTWDAGSSTVTNTQGSISSQVRANATAGFSIVTYTGNASNSTVGHGLGVAPEMLILKNRDSGALPWAVWHKAFGTAGGSDYLYLNSTIAKGGDGSGSFWNSTVPSSTVFSIGSGSTTNTNTNKYVVYCFAPVAGYSSFGSYTGNGSADGSFVFCNFRPRYVLIKRTDSTSYWHIYDSVRNTYNVANSNLWANGSDAEISDAAYNVDILSNGFKLRTSDAARNASAGTYIYAAFAESPFQVSRAR